MKRRLDDAEKLLALAYEKGLKGLRENEAKIFLPLNSADLLSLSQKLEEEGRLRILSFSPLLWISRESLDYLSQKILLFLSQYHKKHPKENGVSLEKIKKRFDVPSKILVLTLRTFIHEGRVREDGHAFALAGFRKLLSPREEQLLRNLEEMCFQGDFRVVTLQDIQSQFHLLPQKLQSLLAVLVERRIIAEGKEGFFLHSRWLDDVIAKIRNLGKKELTVAEFKALTGLSRKFAIPLLELLDEMGITRRVGPIREIL